MDEEFAVGGEVDVDIDFSPPGRAVGAGNTDVADVEDILFPPPFPLVLPPDGPSFSFFVPFDVEEAEGDGDDTLAMQFRQSRNLACAARSEWKDVVSWLSSSSSCFLSWESCGAERVERSTRFLQLRGRY